MKVHVINMGIFDYGQVGYFDFDKKILVDEVNKEVWEVEEFNYEDFWLIIDKSVYDEIANHEFHKVKGNDDIDEAFSELIYKVIHEDNHNEMTEEKWISFMTEGENNE